MESIWHTADEKLIIEKYRIIELNDGRLSLNNTDSRPLSMIKRWCYVDDLLALETELERTRKALDVAKDRLDTVRQYYRRTAVIGPNDIAKYCDRALDQIKQIIETKDVK